MEKNRFVYRLGIVVLIAVIGFKFASRIFRKQLRDLNIMKYVFGLLFPLLGFLIIFAVYEQYDYFVEDPKYLFFKKIFRESGVKIFYYIIGMLLIAAGVMIIF